MSKELWALDPTVVFVNHGSFGACPKLGLEVQSRLRAELEAEPVQFLARELEPRLAAARVLLARFLGADPEGLVFVRNATEGVNTVLQRVPLAPGDELLTTDHAYASCKLALKFVAERSGAKIVVARIPFPIERPEQVTEAVLAAATEKTKLALIDHVTSPTGLIFPVEKIVSELQGRGIDVLVDGAHAPGMLPLELDSLGAAYYTGNCHKWLCAPKGVAVLVVREDRREALRPLVMSHGAQGKSVTSRFRAEFDWSGTFDPTAVLALPAIIEHLGGVLPGGWPALRAHNHALVLEARALLCSALGLTPAAPDSMIGSMVALPLPDRRPEEGEGLGPIDPLGEWLFARHRIEVPVMAWPQPPKRLLRISAQLYNRREDYERLAEALSSSGITSG